VDTPIVESAARVISDKTGRSEDDARDRLAAFNPMGRFVTPDEVAASVMSLVGANSGAVSGHSLIIDGGSQPV
jgi:NAD(P)-dependent dehydrogenase (short-subunit alcohol dehydrogenase family)